ncbi:MAG: putative phage abortive infection protein, partial [Saprospiraceae bacterium]
NMRTNKFEVYAKWLIRSGLILLIFTTLLFLLKSGEVDFSKPLNTNIFDHFGSFIGGLLGAFFSLAGVYLLILNLKSQELDFIRQQVENRFFELLKIHRENCNEIILQDKKGREIFKWLQKEIYKCYEVVSDTNNKTKENIQQGDMINIAYISFYFGAVGQYSSKLVRNYLKNISSDFLNVLIAEFENRRDEITQKEKFPYKLFDGHQSRLDHYFRHIYQTVRYVDQIPNHVLSYRNKYEYITTFRAQLNTQEQVLLFFHSLSSIGTKWEMKGAEKLITKYNLIKNIPEGYVSYINLRDYYPDVKYAGQTEDTENKKKLNIQYQ